MSRPPLHEALTPLRWLVGVYEGTGRGEYPTIDPFGYRERIDVTHEGTPVLAYRQRTHHPDTGRAMHGEAGYLRLATPSRVELVVAHTFGIVEVQEGAVDGGRIEVSSRALAGTATAKDVTGVRRRFEQVDDELHVDLWMAYAHVPETHHLHSVLRRVA